MEKEVECRKNRLNGEKCWKNRLTVEKIGWMNDEKEVEWWKGRCILERMKRQLTAAGALPNSS